MYKQFLHGLLLSLLFLLFSNVSNSQQIFNLSDLSQFKTSSLTDNDILKYLAEVKSSGMTTEQVEKIALIKGLDPAELDKLHQRILLMNQKAETPDNSSKSRELSPITRQTEDIAVSSKIFGADLFSSSSLTFQPDLKIATPVNYILGPDDQLQISIFGLQEASFNLTVSPEGIINIPNVGEVLVSGYTVEQARELIRAKLARIYTSLRSGSSKLAINLGKIRSIHVTVLGSTKPGSYELSSLSSVFNVLYLSGGPAENGSYREIELLRNNKIERKIDLYTFLLSGIVKDNVRLQENDIIRIPVYKSRVEIEGEVKRPGIFEMLPGETIKDLLYFTGGFTDSAYKASMKVIQLTEKEKKVKDLPNDLYNNYQPNTGDHFLVAKILNRFTNRVSIEGAVSRPGNYEISDNLTIGQLIRRSDGLREDAYTERGQLIRLKEDLTVEFIPFNVKQVLNGVEDITLKREDRVIISSIFDLKDAYNITIQGEVRKPGIFRYAEGLSLKDLILQAGGFTDAAFAQRIEIARLLRRDTLTETDKRLSQIIDVRDINDLSVSSASIKLSPFDVVTVRRLPGFLPLESVNATGQVQFPGPYVLQNRSERISDLLKRAGGLTPEAFVEAAFLRRTNVHNISGEIKAETVNKIQASLKDSSNSIVGSVQRNFDQIPLDLQKIITDPGNEEDLVLKPGDELYIPRNDKEVRISGEVLFPTQAPYNDRKSFKDYVSDAGGFTDFSRKRRAYVIYPNGKAASTKHFLFFRSYPKVKPGSEIVVPKQGEKTRRHSTTEVVALASAVASLAYFIIAIFK
jgi:protein involved in polysaccharide export with SLBB domain